MTDAELQEERRQLAVDYASGVAAFLSPAEVRSVSTAGELQSRVEGLLPASQELGRAAAAGLKAAADPLDRAAAEVQLLAGAALDLAVASQLAGTAGPTRAVAAPLLDLAALQALIAAPEAYLVGAAAARSARAVGDPVHTLTDAVHNSLAAITGDVVDSGSHVIEGVLLLDAALLKEAVQAVGTEIGHRLGIDLSGLTGRVLAFILSANSKVLSLAGLDTLDEGRKQLSLWLTQLRGGTLFPDLVRRLYQTQAIESEIDGWITAFHGDQAILLAGRDQVTQLAGQFGAKADIVTKITQGLSLVKLAPPLATPVGRLLVAATYLGLMIFILGSGYDHVDSDRLKLLDRVEGVRGISKRLLAASTS